MRTQFFKEMEQMGNETQCVLVENPRVLYVEQVVGVEKAKESFAHLPDNENPYKNPAVYRAMLRDQYMTIARLKAGL